MHHDHAAAQRMSGPARRTGLPGPEELRKLPKRPVHRGPFEHHRIQEAAAADDGSALCCLRTHRQHFEGTLITGSKGRKCPGEPSGPVPSDSDRQPVHKREASEPLPPSHATKGRDRSPAHGAWPESPPPTGQPSAEGAWPEPRPPFTCLSQRRMHMQDREEGRDRNGLLSSSQSLVAA